MTKAPVWLAPLCVRHLPASGVTVLLNRRDGRATDRWRNVAASP